METFCSFFHLKEKMSLSLTYHLKSLCMHYSRQEKVHFSQLTPARFLFDKFTPFGYHHNSLNSVKVPLGKFLQVHLRNIRFQLLSSKK